MVQPQKKVTKEFLKRLPILGKKPESPKEEAFLKEIHAFEFRNIKDPSLSQKFLYGNTKINYTFLFFDGGTYKVPRHVARHLEECSTPRKEWISDGEGGMYKKLVGTSPRFQMKQVFAFS